MGDVMPHFCTGQGCEALHGGSRESDDVRIAKINADRDVRVAELARNEARQDIEAAVEMTEIAAGASVAEAEIFAEAAVDEAVVEAEVLDEIVHPETEPVQVEITDPGDGGEPEAVSAPPEIESPAGETKSPGWWSGYR